MEQLFNTMIQGTISDVMVSGYTDAETPPVFRPMYERIYFIMDDHILELYIDDGVVCHNRLKNINEWFDIDEEIYLDEEDMEMPLVVKELNLKGWMLVSSLNYIVKNKSNDRDNNQWLIEEINYYREYDTFRT